MTPEIAEYHRAMLLVGKTDKFYQAFDELLEGQEPLSDLIVSLSTVISNENEVLHTLLEYTQNHPFNVQVVYDLVLEDLRSRYLAGEMSRGEVVELQYRIVISLDKFLEDPWNRLADLSYAKELWENGLIDENVFNQCFDSWFFHGVNLDPWALQKSFHKQ